MNSKGMLLAGAVATLFLSGAVAAQAEEKAGGSMVKCAGVNACKGQSACGGGSGGNACHGKNSCKGQGVVEMSAADCATKGGKVVK
jgi:uncharacterized membrane protein